MPLNWYSSMQKKIRKIRTIFDIENWLWKWEIGLFSITWFRADVDLPRKFFIWKSAIFHPIKLPFDAEAAEKFWSYLFSMYLGQIFITHGLFNLVPPSSIKNEANYCPKTFQK